MSSEDNVNNEFGGDTGQSDLTLIMEDYRIPVSKSVLCIASPVFRAMFEGDFEEKSKSEIQFPGKKYEDFAEFLRCIYPDRLKKVTEKNVYQVTPLAHEYQVEKVEHRCEKVLIQVIRKRHINDVVQLYRHIQMSEMFLLDNLKKTCIYLASEHKLEQFETAQQQYPLSDAGHYKIIKLALRRRELDSEDEKHLSKNIDEQLKASSGYLFGQIAQANSSKTIKVEFTLKGYIQANNQTTKDDLRSLRLSKRFNVNDHDVKSEIIKKLKSTEIFKAETETELLEEFNLLPDDIKLALSY